MANGVNVGSYVFDLRKIDPIDFFYDEGLKRLGEVVAVIS